MTATPRLHPTPLGNTQGFIPTEQRPVRVRSRSLPEDSHFEPHFHAWAQLAYCTSGMVQVTAAQNAQASGEVTYIVPPSRAVWVAPGARHHISVLEAAEFHTLYIHASATPAGWQDCRVLVVSPLLRETIQALDQLPPARVAGAAQASTARHSGRERLLSALVLDEITHADIQSLGVALPHPQTGDKRLRALCRAILRTPSSRATLAQWAARIGASERTLTRLFRDELNLSYQQWRQQAVLAHALPLLARGQPVSQVAAASGYASDSAFSAMFKAAMGQPPSHFQNKK